MIQWLTENWKLIASLIIGVYEVLARLIPTVADWSILGKIITFLKWISDSLNNRKK